jgi:hypothetical protein
MPFACIGELHDLRGIHRVQVLGIELEGKAALVLERGFRHCPHISWPQSRRNSPE